MFLHDIELKQFRCFNKRKISFNSPVTIVTGDNGVGKTSVVEAIHYLCYLKSFRTHIMSDLINHDSESFFIKGNFTTKDKQDDHSIQVGYAQRKKAIKLDGGVITSFKDIFNVFRVITVLEDDINLIKGAPTERRSFIDKVTAFAQHNYIDLYRNFKHILQNRNALLSQGIKDQTSFAIWTEQMWKASLQIQECRKKALTELELVANQLLKKHFDDIYTISISYDAKYISKDESFDQFAEKVSSLQFQEQQMRRSLFGAHLDDFTVHIQGKKARNFASRGQQKLISLLLKLAQIRLANNKNHLPLLLLDDFIADFDKKRISGIIDFFSSCENQVIITTPFYDVELQSIFGILNPELLSIA